MIHVPIEARMLGKATRERKCLQMPSDVTSKDYNNMKNEAVVINVPFKRRSKTNILNTV